MTGRRESNEVGLGALVSAAASGSTYEERLQAVRGLGEYPDLQAGETLVDVLFWNCSDDFTVVEQDPRFEPSRPRYTHDEAKRNLRHEAAAALSKLADPRTLKGILTHGGRGVAPGVDASLGSAIDGAIRAMRGPDAGPILVSFLRRDPEFFASSQVREQVDRGGHNRDELAAAQLGIVGYEAGTGVLLEILKDRSRHEDVRAAAATSLGQLNSGVAIEVLEECLLLGEHRHVQLAARNSLYDILGPQAEEVIRRAEEKDQSKQRSQKDDRRSRALQAMKAAEQEREAKGEKTRPKLP